MKAAVCRVEDEMKKDNSRQVDERGLFEFSGTLTYDPEVETLRVDVESLEGHWPFGGDAPEVVHVTCRCVGLVPETR